MSDIEEIIKEWASDLYGINVSDYAANLLAQQVRAALTEETTDGD